MADRKPSDVNGSAAPASLPWPPREDLPVRCRLVSGPLAWCGTVLLLGLIGVAPLAAVLWMIWISPPTAWGDWVAACCLLLMVAGAITLPLAFLIAFLCRAEIFADADGVRWRGAGRWRVARWDEVTDYYYRRPTSSSSGDNAPPYFIETLAGKIVFSERGWTQTERLRKCVVMYATAARAEGWGVQGERPQDWPIVFHYDTKFNRAAPRELVFWHILMFASVVAWFGYEWLTRHTLPAWGWLLTPTGLFLIAKEFALAAMHFRFRDTRRRVGEQITVFDDGLVFEDGTHRVETDWDGISDFFSTLCRAGGRYVVVTEQGEFDFLATIQKGELLQRIIALRAKDGAWGTWRYEPARWRRMGRLDGYRT